MRFLRAERVFFAVALFFFHSAFAETYVLTNAADNTTVTFTNTTGTAYTTNGTMVVFEGQLDADWGIAKAYDSTSEKYLASVRLLTQIKLYDELPASNEVGNVQGAVVALRDETGSSNGTYYVWGVTNAAPVAEGWAPLLSTNGTAFTVVEGATNYITFVFSYPESGPVQYKVYIGDVGDTVMSPSVWVTSATTATAGITSVSLVGSGTLEGVASTNGSPVSLSSSISFDVFYSVASNKVYGVVTTEGEQGSNLIKIMAWINNGWVLVGSFAPIGDGEGHTYYVALTGLTPGQSYKFLVEDEEGHEFYSTASQVVRTINIGETYFSMADDLQMRMMNVKFNTEKGKCYQVRVSSDLSRSADQWQVEYVRHCKTDGTFGVLTNEFVAGDGDQSLIQIPVNTNKAFFKIFQLQK